MDKPTSLRLNDDSITIIPEGKAIIGEQIRSARGALNWSARELAHHSGVAAATTVRYELDAGVSKSRKDNLAVLGQTLEIASVEFIGTPGDAPGIRIHGGVSNT